MRGPYRWLRPGDMLVACEIDPSVTGVFYRLSESTSAIIVGPPLSSPPRPGAYYMKSICMSWCDSGGSMYSSRPLGRGET